MRPIAHLGFFVSIFLVSLNGFSQETEKPKDIKYVETIMVRIIENQCHDFTEGWNGASANSTDSRMIVVGPDGDSETIPLQKTHLAKESDESFLNNSRKVKIVIQKWNNKEFQVISVASTTVRECIMITTIMMGKN